LPGTGRVKRWAEECLFRSSGLGPAAAPYAPMVGRRPRVQTAGGFSHVTTRGNRGQRIFEHPSDPPLFVHLVARNVRRLNWRCHSFCLMPNHYHLVVETPDPNLSIGMERLNGIYAKWFNHAHGFEGHLFERRFHSVGVERDAHMLELARYLALNPVRAGLCRDPSEWRWSSYRAMIGEAPRPEFLTCEWLLSLFDQDPRRAPERFAAFVAEGRIAPRAVTDAA
jgi:putative transposase